MLVAEKTIKEMLVRSGLTEDIIPTRANMFRIKNIRVSFLFPKYFNIFTLLESIVKANKEDRVYNNPTYLSEITPVKKVELMYEDKAMWKVKRNDNRYILFILG